jgi:hypothetical protein
MFSLSPGMRTDQQKRFIEFFSPNRQRKCRRNQSGVFRKRLRTTGGTILKTKVFNRIDTETRKAVDSAVRMAVDKLKQLIDGDKISPSVKLGASNSVIDGTGYQTRHKVEDVSGQKTEEDLRQELNHLISTMLVIKSNDGGCNGSLN